MLKVYHKYILKNYLISFIQVTLVFLSLVCVLNIFEEINFFKDLDVSIGLPIFLTFLNIPSILFEIFPFIFLITTQFFFIRLIEQNENISFNYNFKDSIIKIDSPEKKSNQKIKLNSTIELNPFLFDGDIIFEEKNINFITDYILNAILNLDQKLIENFNGILRLILSNLDSKLLNSGKISLSINEGEIKAENSFFEIYKIGTIKTNFKYINKRR